MDIQANQHRSHTGLWIVIGLILLFAAVYWMWGDVISQSLLGQLLNTADVDTAAFYEGINEVLDQQLSDPYPDDPAVRAESTDQLLDVLFTEF